MNENLVLEVGRLVAVDERLVAIEERLVAVEKDRTSWKTADDTGVRDCYWGHYGALRGGQSG